MPGPIIDLSIYDDEAALLAGLRRRELLSGYLGGAPEDDDTAGALYQGPDAGIIYEVVSRHASRRSL